MMPRLKFMSCALLLGVGLLAGCGGMDDSASDSGGTSGEAPQAASQDSGANAVKPADVAKAAAATTTVTSLVRTAEITVEVKNVDAAARSVRTSAVALGGLVSNESTKLPLGPEPVEDSDTASQVADQQSTITLRVPEPKMDDALTSIAKVGREVDRSTSSEDVTATIVDLDSRVTTQTRSVARVRALLDRANSLQDVVTLESELARRESDLESIQARQRALSDKAALATVTVNLRSAEAVAQAPEEAGFLAGLDSGWTALKASTTVVLTVLGAVLPIAVVIVVIGIPVYLLRRRFVSQAPAPGPSVATAAPGPDHAPPI
jgi:hypothetical protein